MSLSGLASVGNFVSGVAVLVSLVYLALQVRQAEKNPRALINEAVITRVSGMLLEFAQQPFVLHIPPVTSPRDAIRTAAVAETRRE